MSTATETRASWSLDGTVPWPCWQKEIRALMPAWLGALALPFLFGLPAGGEWETAWVGFFIGCNLLGAVVMGHEYDYQTMGLLLSQPVDRRLLWGVKMTVLLGGMLAIALLYVPLALVCEWHRYTGSPQALASLFGAGCAAVLSGVCGAPLVALGVRNTLAAAVLANAAPLALWLTGSLITYLRFGEAEYESSAAQTFLVRYGVAALCLYCVLGLVGHYRCFARLQAVETQGQGGGLAVWLRRMVKARAGEQAVARRVHRGASCWPMLAKEVRLQSTTFLLGGLFMGGFALFSHAAKHGAGEAWRELFWTLMTLYQALVMVLAGASCCAEERRLGILPSQLILPRNAMAQWWGKVGVAAMVGGLLGLVAPAVCVHLAPAGVCPGGENFWWNAMIESHGAVMLLCLLGVAVYASSFATSSLKAFIWTLALAALVTGMAFAAGVGASATTAGLFTLLRFSAVEVSDPLELINSVFPSVTLVNAVLMVAAMALLAGGWNYRNLGPQPARWLRQIIWVVGLPILLAVLAAAVLIGFRLQSGELTTHRDSVRPTVFASQTVSVSSQPQRLG